MFSVNFHINRLSLTVTLSIYMLFINSNLCAQGHQTNNQKFIIHDVENSNVKPDKIKIYFAVGSNCKLTLVDSLLLDIDQHNGTGIRINSIETVPFVDPTKIPFLQLHGNIHYSFDYNSLIDTPFAVSNLQRHQEQTFMDANLKGRYSFRIFINARQSNTTFFKCRSDISVQFNQRAYSQNIREAMIAEISNKFPELQSEIEQSEAILNSKKDKYLQIKNWINNPARVQDVIEDREKKFREFSSNEMQNKLVDFKTSSNLDVSVRKKFDPFSQLKTFAKNKLANDSFMMPMNLEYHSVLSIDSTVSPTQKKIKDLESKLDSLKNEIRRGEAINDSLKKIKTKKIADCVSQVKGAKSFEELSNIQKKIGTQSLRKEDRTILAITQLNIGRSDLNYSELTVKNISLSGLNLEFHPKYYTAFAIGKVDYLFNDYIIQTKSFTRQNLMLGRLGWGKTKNKIFILTAYSGKKNSFGNRYSDTTRSQSLTVPIQIFGYSLEAKYKINNNIDFSVEAAKSSAPSNNSGIISTSYDHAFAFTDRNNEAFFARMDVRIPTSRSDIHIYYKKIGSSFQSFSAFTSGIKQEMWGIKWGQQYFKNHLSSYVQVRKNNFENSLLQLPINSATIFKSVQLLYRNKRHPVISIAYLPTSQLIKNSSGDLSQNIYYVLTGSVLYNYTLKKLAMSSNIIYNRYYNTGNDSSFRRYAGKYLIFSQIINFRKLHATSDIQYTNQQLFNYWAFQQRLDLTINKNFTVGGGLKNNFLSNSRKSFWGGSVQSNISLSKIGKLRVQYSKDFLPNGIGSFSDNNWGRVSWFRSF